MIQTIDFAPLDGITKIVFRQVWSQFFGGVDRYFIPFFPVTIYRCSFLSSSRQ